MRRASVPAHARCVRPETTNQMPGTCLCKSTIARRLLTLPFSASLDNSRRVVIAGSADETSGTQRSLHQSQAESHSAGVGPTFTCQRVPRRRHRHQLRLARFHWYKIDFCVSFFLRSERIFRCAEFPVALIDERTWRAKIEQRLPLVITHRRERKSRTLGANNVPAGDPGTAPELIWRDGDISLERLRLIDFHWSGRLFRTDAFLIASHCADLKRRPAARSRLV